MRSRIFFTVYFLITNALGAGNQDREGFIQALMQLRPGRNTIMEVEKLLQPPLHREEHREGVVFAYRLNSKAGDPEYDVFLTFFDGLLIQVERPVLDRRWNLARMLQLYGRPNQTKDLPASEFLPRRTMYVYREISRSFIRRNDTKKFISVIEYKKH